MTSLCALLHMYGTDYSRGTLSVTFHLAFSADYVTTPSTDGSKFGRQVLNNGAQVLLLDGRHLLEVMQQLHVDGNVDQN